MANPLEAPARRFDNWQHRYRPTAFTMGIVKKYVDDRGTNIAATLAYHGFVAVAPLLLVFFTVLGFLLPHDAALDRAITNSALSDFPVIGSSLKSPTLHGSVLAVVFGLLISLWGATGVTRTFQWAMAEIWNVPGKERSDFFPRQVRGLMLLCIISLGVGATATLNAIGSVLSLGTWSTVILAVPATAVNVGLIYVSFYILTPGRRRRRDLLPGAVIAGVGYELLQTLGVNLVVHYANRASEFYQTFGIVVGFLAFVYIAAQLVIFSAEYNAVRAHHLWPRNLQQPPFTDVDRTQLVLIAKREERARGMRVTVTFDPDPAPEPDSGAGPVGAVNGARDEAMESEPQDGQTAPHGRVVER